MPIIKGIGKREGESRDTGAATLVIGFPQATLKVAKRNPVNGAISFDSVPNPHDKAFNLSELRAMQAVLEAGSVIRQFYEQAESLLLRHIEGLGQGIAHETTVAAFAPERAAITT